MDLIIDTDRKRKFMVVKPVQSLLNSRLIREVLASGRKFVVDLDTGELTVHGKAERRLRGTPFHFLRHGDKVYDLPSKWNQETEDIIYDFYINTVENGKSFLYYGEDRTIRVVVQGGWRNFKEHVERYYKMMS